MKYDARTPDRTTRNDENREVGLCRDCRFCRPLWWILAMPILSLVPATRHAAWEVARCRHSHSFYTFYRIPADDYVLGRRSRPLRPACVQVREDEERCGPMGRYWVARRIPARAWSIGITILGHAAVLAYFLS